MPHPNEKVIRDIFAAFAAGDLDGVLDRCTEDVLFRLPGSGRAAGDYRGRHEFMSKLLPALAGVADMSTFSERVEFVTCDDDYGMALITQSFTRTDGRAVSYRIVPVMSFRDGLLSAFEEWAGNEAEYDDAWS
jgi:ketosteroid isomerase-like protein